MFDLMITQIAISQASQIKKTICQIKNQTRNIQQISTTILQNLHKHITRTKNLKSMKHKNKTRRIISNRDFVCIECICGENFITNIKKNPRIEYRIGIVFKQKEKHFKIQIIIYLVGW